MVCPPSQSLTRSDAVELVRSLTQEYLLTIYQVPTSSSTFLWPNPGRIRTEYVPVGKWDVGVDATLVRNMKSGFELGAAATIQRFAIENYLRVETDQWWLGDCRALSMGEYGRVKNLMWSSARAYVDSSYPNELSENFKMQMTRAFLDGVTSASAHLVAGGWLHGDDFHVDGPDRQRITTTELAFLNGQSVYGLPASSADGQQVWTLSGSRGVGAGGDVSGFGMVSPSVPPDGNPAGVWPSWAEVHIMKGRLIYISRAIASSGGKDRMLLLGVFPDSLTTPSETWDQMAVRMTASPFLRVVLRKGGLPSSQI